MRAHTRPLAAVHDGDLDLNDVARGDGYLFVRDGVGIAGRGAAAHVPLADVAAVLAAIEHTDDVGGVHPIALGVVPFEAGLPCELIIPRVLVGKAADGRQWVTTVHAGPGDGPPVDLSAPPRPSPRAQSFTVSPL
ncbi:MAG: hypothetical protein KBF94_16160, partial [Ilumatobacteraceae bacterium]|nr:hypothetical protein [Ilumatobacteraceae bacterium]